MPDGEVNLEPPPELSRPLPRNVLGTLMPVVLVAGLVGFIVITGANTTSMLMGGMMAMSMVGMLVNQGGRPGKSPAAVDEERKHYQRYLAQMRIVVRDAAAAQRAAQIWAHPDPEALIGVARSRRMWERRRTDRDYCQVRLGRGTQRLATPMVPPQSGRVEEWEPVSALALRRLVRAHALVADLPIAVDLRGFPAVSIVGDDARPLARAMILQACAFHTPDDLIVAVVSCGANRARWEWVKWLPHAQHPTESDAVGRIRMIGDGLLQVEDWLRAQLADRARFSKTETRRVDGPHVIIVLDGAILTGEERVIVGDGLSGVTLIEICGAGGTLAARRGLRLESSGGRVGALTPTAVEWWGEADVVSAELAESIARELAPWRVGADSATTDQPLVGATGLMGLLGLGDAATFDLASAWRPRSIRDRLRIPIGLSADGSPVELDIKEAADGGMGPHGLIIGATGSGKSEVLRTLVMGLAATHSSSALNFVLIDFKGGATFLGLQDLPHVAAVITNLSDDLAMVDRMRDALSGEMNRRQELLRNAGNFASVKDYERARENGGNLEPLPSLLIVCDEFTELLAQKSDFAELFVAIGRLGRSLSMHLLLASQRLEEGRMRGLDSHLSYRIGLKTFSAAESRAVLDVPDAYELPPVPGSGFLKFDTTSMIRFKAAYVSGAYAPVTLAAETVLAADRRPRIFGSEYVQIPLPDTDTDTDTDTDGDPGTDVGGVERSVLDVMVKRLVGRGPPAHGVWLPPLTESPTVNQLLPPISTSDRGLGPVGWQGNGRLQVPIAVLDRPYEQRRDLMWADFAGASGNGVVVGGPQSGKSTLLSSIITALALTHTPDEVQFYCVDLGGGALAALADLPHVGDVASRGAVDVVRRMVAEMVTVMKEREAGFRKLGIVSMVAFRAAGAAGRLPDEKFGDVFLVIDGWGTFRSEFEELEAPVAALAQQGLSYGVHILLAANRWAEIRPAMKDMMGSRFELRLGDPAESEIDRRSAAGVPARIPGRGLSSEKLHFLTALPRIDSMSTADDLALGMAAMVAAHRAAWSGSDAPKVRLLPTFLPYSALPTPEQDGHRKDLPVGISEATLQPVHLDFNAEPHFLVLGDAECGKTTFLSTLAHQLISRNTPGQAKILLVDYRRTLLQAIPQEYLAGYAAGAGVLTAMIDDVRTLLQSRLPGPNTTPEQLRSRSWWSGAELFVLVDDYDLVATPAGNPLAPLVEFLPQARDVGLHLVICRRAGGAGRTMYEPLMQRIRELAAPGVLMSGSRDEGVLLGTMRPSAMPPGRGTLVSRRIGQQLIQFASRHQAEPAAPIRPVHRDFRSR